MLAQLALVTFLLLGGIAVALLIISRSIYRVRPDEVAVFTGSNREIVDPDSGETRTVGFRIVHGQSTFKIPVLERVDRLSLAEMSISIVINDLRDAKGRVWTLELLMNARVAPSEPQLMRAIERFLGMSGEEIETIIANTVEARLRNELIAHDLWEGPGWGSIEPSLTQSVGADLERLGIHLDTITFEGPPRASYSSGPNGGAPDAVTSN